jgi:hypothetical protein
MTFPRIPLDIVAALSAALAILSFWIGDLAGVFAVGYLAICVYIVASVFKKE